MKDQKPIWKRRVTKHGRSRFGDGIDWEVTIADFGKGLVIFENGVWHNQWDSIITEWESKHGEELTKIIKKNLLRNITSEYDPFDENTSQITVFVKSRNFHCDGYKTIKLTKNQTEKIKSIRL